MSKCGDVVLAQGVSDFRHRGAAATCSKARPVVIKRLVPGPSPRCWSSFSAPTTDEFLKSLSGKLRERGIGPDISIEMPLALAPLLLHHHPSRLQQRIGDQAHDRCNRNSDRLRGSRICACHHRRRSTAIAGTDRVASPTRECFRVAKCPFRRGTPRKLRPCTSQPRNLQQLRERRRRARPQLRGPDSGPAADDTAEVQPREHLFEMTRRGFASRHVGCRLDTVTSARGPPSESTTGHRYAGQSPLALLRSR